MLSIALTNTGINTQREMEEEGAMYSLSVLVSHVTMVKGASYL
jgi:hypothetical protein